MAESPSHKFGQIIGDLLERVLHEPLEAVAQKHGLYLDYQHKRPARGNRKKVRWLDDKGNSHDLDYVLEHGGNEVTIGNPKAFIESAWRRYTKHSRNKAQEIQGAVSVLAETYSDFNPFLGAVLAGVFTEGSLDQLKSHGFSCLYCSYDIVVAAFATVGIDSEFDEATPTEELQGKVDAYDALSEQDRDTLASALRTRLKPDLEKFLIQLETSLTRSISRIFITGLHGPSFELKSIDAAVQCIEGYSEASTVSGFVRYEVDVRYSNDDQINGRFAKKQLAIDFLRRLN